MTPADVMDAPKPRPGALRRILLGGTAAKERDRIEGALEPAGYRILIRIPHLEAQMKKNAGLVMPEETRRLEEFAQLCGQVIALGPLCFRDRKRFGFWRRPWCRPGDYVMVRAYAGTRFAMRSQEGKETIYALINDDTVQAVVRGDYEDIERVR